MDKAKCADNNHAWTCKEESGFLNEITTFRALSAAEVNNLKNDTKLESAICPKGAIVCNHCGEYLNKDKSNTSIPKKLKLAHLLSCI